MCEYKLCLKWREISLTYQNVDTDKKIAVSELKIQSLSLPLAYESVRLEKRAFKEKSGFL